MIEMDNKRALTELIGSLAVVYFAVSGGAMATGLVLAIFMIAMGGTILPMFTLAKMASGRDEIEEGALDFLMQILGGVLAYSFVWWQTTATGDMTWSGVAELGPNTAVASLFAGFLMMMVYDRRGGGWEVGILAWMVALGGATISGAGDVGGMLVDSAWDGANILGVFGGMVCAGLGAYLAIMFGENVLGEEE
ncbi:MAG TPA: hypothetical protein QF802_01980 [Candidatus Thalassarchaeaceae archaeon]|jgi:hypothetical protein|nr:hypothetical protein [Candidatus Poseidoniaceae archaeon]HJM19211.1 hypothetical protein [Candidatus Thalassarchaeaceae archaeon]